MDTGVFDENRYFDVFMEYAKAAPEDILIKITAWNRGPEEAQLDLLPTLWFRNIWSFGEKHGHPKLCARSGFSGRGGGGKPRKAATASAGCWPKARRRCCSRRTKRTFSVCSVFQTGSPYVKDSFHDYVIEGVKEAVNPAQTGHEVRGALSRSRSRRARPRRCGCD